MVRVPVFFKYKTPYFYRMAYNMQLAERLRTYLAGVPGILVEEKKMFRGLAFMVNGKMCINVSGDNLMCRFDPDLQETVAARKGYQLMLMKGRAYKGYCYVTPEGLKTKKDFAYWVSLCLDFNERAKSSGK